MRQITRIISAFFCTLCVVHGANCAQYQSSTTTPSKYGLIQNVQSYSSNPFWNSNSPYNQTMPVPVYVQGADLNTTECKQTVSILVASYCASNNNCVGMTLSDVRPTIMVQLSRLPGHNYATACSGYIDSEFNSYVSKYANAGPSNRATAFPSATAPNTGTQSQTFEIKNPYEVKTAPWAQEMIDRKNELKDLQSSNGASNPTLARADFPTTIADVSFTERMENKAAGYEPFKDKSAYQKINIESKEDYLVRKEKLERTERELYCNQNPNDTERCGHRTSGTQNNTSGTQNNNGSGNNGGDTIDADPDEIVFIL